MTIKIRIPNISKTGIRARENKEFDEIIKLPSDEDTDSVQNFLTLTDVLYNKATHSELDDILDGDGKCAFEVNFYVDMEMANRANVRKVRFQVYTKDPTKRVTTSIDSKVGTRQYFNERFLVSMNRKSKCGGKGGYGKAASKSSNNVLEKTLVRKDLSTLFMLNDGLIKTFEMPIMVSDKSVNEIRKADRALITEPRMNLSQLSVARALTVTDSSQVYTVTLSPKININNSMLCTTEGQLGKLTVNNQTNLVDSKVTENFDKRVQESEQYLSRRALLSERSDPTAHLNCFYASGPSAAPGSSKNPVQYVDDQQTVFKNEVDVSTSGKDITSGFMSACPDNRQNITTQKSANFSGNPYLQSLYRKSAEVAGNLAFKGSLSKVPLRNLVFKSTLRQQKMKFDLDFTRLRPNQTKEIYVKMELLDKDSNVFKSRLLNVDFRRQIKGILTPNLPPKLRVFEQSPGKVTLEVEQIDPLATDITLFRMIASPDTLDDAHWVKVGDIRANARRGAVKYTDSTVSGNVLPNIVLYEARCSGLFGSVCSSTTKIVENGVKRVPNLKRPSSFGECNIVAVQNGSKLEIRVSRIPFGVNRIFLRRQHINTSSKERDFRKHDLIKTQGSLQDFHIVRDSDGVFSFEDNNVINRQIYRYYVQFDWQDRERTNSVTDEYIEYRRLPDKPIVSYMENIVSGIDERGRPTVSFDLGATFANEGLDELNRLLGETGVSSIFVEELRKDRSLVSNLLVYEVTRRNNKTGDTIVWPLVNEGRFVDNIETRRSAKGGSERIKELELKSGNEYLYTSRLLIINPERFFKEALTRLPASTRQVINDTDPNFVKVSAAKFAENFAVQPGTVLSPTTLEKENDFRTEVQGAFTGVIYRSTIRIPILKAVAKNVRLHRNVIGKASNVLKWEIEGAADTVFSFQIDILIGRENRMPLRSVSPSVSDNGKYEIRDELFVREVAPVFYSVSVIYTDMSKSSATNSNEIHAGSTLPVRIIDLAIRRQLPRVIGADLSKVLGGTIDERLLQANSDDALLAGSLASADIDGSITTDQLGALRNASLSPERQSAIDSLNPSRRTRR